ncbi:MAG: class II fumarate hydratase, partial [Novosphingobium sp.]|nr:class II fumarate hydratase [Novosphingobium sp.]
MSETRLESDSIGDIAVPAAAYWGAQTQRSLENFPFADRERMPWPVIVALAQVKMAAAQVHASSRALPAEIADAIIEAGASITIGQHADQFPLAIWQTGSGTQTNMNVNEVIAGLANERLAGARGGKTPVHPNDHVNKGMSSNDAFPTALHIAALREAEGQLIPALMRLRLALQAKADAWSSIVKIGRTHLQ